MTMKKLLFALAVTALSSGVARADDDHSFWWYQKAKIACIGDVMRLCRSAMPDADKVRGCMADKKTQVSESCAAFYPGGSQAD